MSALRTAALFLALGGCSAAELPVQEDTGSSEGGALPDRSVDGEVLPDEGGITITPAEGGTMATATSLVLSPADPTLDVTVVDGVVTQVADGSGAPASPLLFHVVTDTGTAVTANWSFDRGELGAVVAASGAFSASGTAAGTGKLTAQFGALIRSTSVTVRLHASQNGAPPPGDSGTADADSGGGTGGLGGVGGKGPGGKVTDPLRAQLEGAGQAPATPLELGWLYPYDKTVWPRGILAPLLQWRTTHPASAVYIHLQQKNYEFRGFYSGSDLVNHPLDPAAWKQALASNGGEPLHVEIKISDGSNTYGPIAQNWLVAPGVLKGTVYYNSYNTKLATPIVGEQSAAAVLAIKPGSSDPALAIPDSGNKCIVCHTVSDDGSTLFAQVGKSGNDYSEGASYDLTQAGTRIQSYAGTATDTTTNNRKFLWSGPWKDGTFSLQSSGHTQEAYAGPSRLFRRDDGTAIPAPGLDDVVKEAVTPAFSRGGQQIAFGFWTGYAAGAGGEGHSLDVFDSSCTPAASKGAGPSCTSVTFSRPRRLYTNPDAAQGYVGWPAWLPNSAGILFHNTLVRPSSMWSSPLATWQGAKAQIWWTDVPQGAGVAQVSPLNALNGLDPAQVSYLPKVAGQPLHDDDARMNYEPTVNPIPSGGYFWVVFTSRRMYGNVATGKGGDPYDNGDGTYPIPKKLWVAAIDMNPVPGQDPSHPAFYLPGQELNAGNMRGFWVVDPCHPNGSSCESGDECCNGFCRASEDGGSLVCGDKPPGCAQEFEQCSQTADCCGAAAGYVCVNNVCTQPPPPTVQ